jgi:hypothetical protein
MRYCSNETAPSNDAASLSDQVALTRPVAPTQATATACTCPSRACCKIVSSASVHCNSRIRLGSECEGERRCAFTDANTARYSGTGRGASAQAVGTVHRIKRENDSKSIEGLAKPDITQTCNCPPGCLWECLVGSHYVKKTTSRRSYGHTNGASKLVRRDAEFLRPEAKLVVVMDVDTFPLTDALGLVVEHGLSEGNAADDPKLVGLSSRNLK